MNKVATIEDVENIVCEQGNVRSLAMNAKGVFAKLNSDNPSKDGWNFAKAVKTNFGDRFTQDDARKYFKKVYVNGESKADSKAKVTSSNGKKEAKEFSKSANAIINNPSMPKNEKIRRLIKEEYGLSQIAKALDLQYQRVKNVLKNERKKTEKAEN